MTTTEHAQAPSAMNVMEMVGVSGECWGDAARLLVARASRSIRHILGLDLVLNAAVVRDGEIIEYHVTASGAFILEPAAIDPWPPGRPRRD